MANKNEMRQAGIAFEKPYKQLLADSDSLYWKDGSTRVMVYPALRYPETARPFVVRMRSEHWIPINHIVWGEDEYEARERLLNAMEWCVAHEYERPSYSQSQAGGILKQYAAGEMHIEAEELDIMGIYDVEWSSRGF